MKWWKKNWATVLWGVWIAMFVVLEAIGLMEDDDKAYTLTNRIRAVMRAHPSIKWVVRGGIAVGLAWLGQHFLLVDPEVNVGSLGR